MIDLEIYRRYRATLTGWNWFFYHYGPHAFEIESIVTLSPFGLGSEEVTTQTGHRAQMFRESRQGLDALHECLERDIGGSKLAIVDRVIKEWALEGLPAILDYVYFDTEPMAAAERGKALDLTAVRPATYVPRHPPDRIQETQSIKALRQRFQRIAAARKTSGRFRLDPPPPFDDVYYDALATTNAEEMAKKAN